MNSPAAPELVKWYTRARRFPQLIGRTPDGAKIWGGPYTFTQAIGAGVIALVAVNTMGIWANYGFIGNTLLLVGVTYGGVLLLGRIPVGSRSPISVVSGGLHAIMSPRTGRLGGQPVRLRRPHVVRHRVTVALDHPPAVRRVLRHRASRLQPAALPVRPAAVPVRPAALPLRPMRPVLPVQRIQPSEPARPPQGAQPAEPADPSPEVLPLAAERPSLNGVQMLLAQGRTPSTERY